ncbi:4-hydroxyphenylacetate catabolism regulatory protein HpaA [Serratia plymuthica]|uniref:4-hydroxyphenylacetate catabolism regulatory protein HpaA n=1 Tax=Serratia plymuthica TaxID=82996 RepID=A0A2X4U9B1_SERPL|nr:4-hydroxyphenylacetate catabolism regulatory protein HpaA [Serratia plymuthica]
MRATPPMRCITKPSPGWRRFFGRDMQVHWHDRFFQVHFLETGKIELQLDSQHYSVQAPLFILTPPSVPHAFFTEPVSDGHVLTVRQELIWPLLERLYPGSNLALDMPGICLSMADAPQELAALSHYWPLIRREFGQQLAGREQTLALLAQAVFTLLLRNAALEDTATSGVRGELKLFQRFNKMVDERFRDHLPVPDYARALGVTESRLNDLCRRFANQPPKRLIFDRLLREAKRMLLSAPVPCMRPPIAWGSRTRPISPVFSIVWKAVRLRPTAPHNIPFRNLDHNSQRLRQIRLKSTGDCAKVSSRNRRWQLQLSNQKETFI